MPPRGLPAAARCRAISPAPTGDLLVVVEADAVDPVAAFGQRPRLALDPRVDDEVGVVDHADPQATPPSARARALSYLLATSKLLTAATISAMCQSSIAGKIGSEQFSEASRSATGRSPAAEAELGVGGLQVDRRRVVDRAGHAAGVEVVAQGVALGRADDEEVVDVVAVGRRRGGQRSRLLSASAARSAAAASRRRWFQSVEVAQLDLEDRRLQRVEAVGAGGQLVVVAGALAVRAQQPHLGVELGVVGDQGAAVAPAAEVLGRVEAEAAGVAERADAGGPVEGAVGLAGVLDHGDPALAAELEDRVHVDRAAEEVDRDHAAGALGQRRARRSPP